MRRFVTALISIYVSLPIFAQKEGEEDKNHNPMVINTLETAVDSGINKALLITIQTLEEENAKIKAQISLLSKDTASLKKTINLQLKNVKKLEQEKFEDKQRYEGLKQKYDDLISHISKVDELIYKQCLLYPLEAKYNEQSVKEALDAVMAFKQLTPNPSAKLIEYLKIYKPLLEQYPQYNEQLLKFFTDKYNHVKMTNWVISDSHKGKFRGEIKQLQYYNDCYIKRNDPPYYSIIYLDEAIDRFFSILEKSGNVEKDFQVLVKSLQPKDTK